MYKPLLLNIWTFDAVRGERLTSGASVHQWTLDVSVVVTPLARRVMGIELNVLSCANPARIGYGRPPKTKS